MKHTIASAHTCTHIPSLHPLNLRGHNRCHPARGHAKGKLQRRRMHSPLQARTALPATRTWATMQHRSLARGDQPQGGARSQCEVPEDILKDAPRTQLFSEDVEV
eukprot:1141868-Pelagomonas_calceolata.AAC.1